MSRVLLFLSFLSVFFACQQEPARQEPPVAKRESWKNYGCELITDEELSRIFKFDPTTTALKSRSLPDQVFCLRTWHKPDWKERETNNEKEGAEFLSPSNRLVLQMFDYTSEVHATQQMEMLRRDRRATYEEDVKGIGEDALWSTGTVTLLVKKGQLVVNISLEYYDKPHDNLEKAKDIAEVILKKL